MPEYNFICDKDSGGCGHEYTEYISIADYDDAVFICSKCKESKFVVRDYSGIRVQGSVPHTLGSIIDRNTSRMSEDEKQHLSKKTRQKNV